LPSKSLWLLTSGPSFSGVLSFTAGTRVRKGLRWKGCSARATLLYTYSPTLSQNSPVGLQRRMCTVCFRAKLLRV
jgi:hypothetical protein